MLLLSLTRTLVAKSVIVTPSMSCSNPELVSLGLWIGWTTGAFLKILSDYNHLELRAEVM